MRERRQRLKTEPRVLGTSCWCRQLSQMPRGGGPTYLSLQHTCIKKCIIVFFSCVKGRNLAARLAILGAVLAVMAGGCGGDSSSSSSDAGLSQAEFVREATAVCEHRKRQLQRDLLEYGRSYGKRNPGETVAAEAFPGGFRTVALPALQAQVDELRKLGLPEGGGDAVEKYLTAMQQAVDAARERTPASGDQFLRDFETSGDLARGYGLDACAYG